MDAERLAALEAAGVKGAADRQALLDFLAAQGFSAEDMAAAESRDRLFALAGDVQVRSGAPLHTLRSAAAELGVALADVRRAWSALGLPVPHEDDRVLSDADVAGLRTWADIRALVGDAVSYGLLRVLGAAMARLAEAESSAIRAAVREVTLSDGVDEADTARAWGQVATLVPRIGALMDAVHRQHIDAARAHFEGVAQAASAGVLCGVGFADLSGFTALSHAMPLDALSELLTEFADTASDVVHQHGGRVVKLIGDAVMWVSADAGRLADTALHLVRHPDAAKAGISVRAGIAFGPALALDGDYFGDPVNLAARLVAVAEPGQALAAGTVVTRLREHELTALPSVPLRGFGETAVFLLG
jgi:class 3 adenylate cyclase